MPTMSASKKNTVSITAMPPRLTHIMMTMLIFSASPTTMLARMMFLPPSLNIINLGLYKL